MLQCCYFNSFFPLLQLFQWQSRHAYLIYSEYLTASHQEDWGVSIHARYNSLKVGISLVSHYCPQMDICLNLISPCLMLTTDVLRQRIIHFRFSNYALYQWLTGGAGLYNRVYGRIPKVACRTIFSGLQTFTNKHFLQYFYQLKMHLIL